MKDISDKKFGKLLVISIAFSKKGVIYWNCKCDCGNEKIVSGFSLRIGDTKSCGCISKTRLLKHGKSYSKEYGVWHKMKGRCLNKKDRYYLLYGARGITVCEKWLRFEGFYEDMGNRPSNKHSLDRIDNNQGYYKENCRWATYYQQQNNKRSSKLIEYDNKKLSLPEWCRELNIPFSRTRARLLYGYSLEEAFNPIKLKGK